MLRLPWGKNQKFTVPPIRHTRYLSLITTAFFCNLQLRTHAIAYTQVQDKKITFVLHFRWIPFWFVCGWARGKIWVFFNFVLFMGLMSKWHKEIIYFVISKKNYDKFSWVILYEKSLTLSDFIDIKQSWMTLLDNFS